MQPQKYIIPNVLFHTINVQLAVDGVSQSWSVYTRYIYRDVLPVQVMSVIGGELEVIDATQLDRAIPAIKRKVQYVSDALRRAPVHRDVSNHVTGRSHRRMLTADVVVEKPSFGIPAADGAKIQ